VNAVADIACRVTDVTEVSAGEGRGGFLLTRRQKSKREIRRSDASPDGNGYLSYGLVCVGHGLVVSNDDRIAEPKVASSQSLCSSGVRRREVGLNPGSDPGRYSAPSIVCNDCDELSRAGRHKCRGT
jgi:hypothetical protein